MEDNTKVKVKVAIANLLTAKVDEVTIINTIENGFIFGTYDNNVHLLKSDIKISYDEVYSELNPIIVEEQSLEQSE